MTFENVENWVYESPDGGKTIYRRMIGSSNRHLYYEDPVHLKQKRINERWVNLKEIVVMAEQDVSVNDALEKLEMLFTLKKQHD